MQVNVVLHGLVQGLSFLLLITHAQADRLPFPERFDYRQLAETALVETTKGPFEVVFYRREAPITVRNFQYLASKGFYENLLFHRYYKDFLIQGGDPTGTGKGGPGYSLPPEFSSIKHKKGTIGMARIQSEANPQRRSNGSQFYISLARRSPQLDGLQTVFGEVVSGMGNVMQLRKGDKILRIVLPQKR